MRRLQRHGQRRLVCSCLVLAPNPRAEDRDHRGHGEGDQLHPLQKKSSRWPPPVRHLHAGFLIASKALLESIPPDRGRGPLLVAGNLCRCTGYDKIVTAVLDVPPK